MQAYNNEEDVRYDICTMIAGIRHHGVFIGCGADNCAAIERKTRRIFYFPKSGGYSFILPDS